MKKKYFNFTVILSSSIHVIAMEEVADQMKLIAAIRKHPETIANIVDTPNVVSKKEIDIFYFEEELNNSPHLPQLEKSTSITMSKK